MGERRRPANRRTIRRKLALTERDKEIIRDVYRFRFLTSGQLAERFFPSKSKADRRLRLLYDHGYLDRIVRPSERGSSELIYVFSTKSADLLAQERGIQKSELSWKPSFNKVSPHTLEHEIDIVRFHLAIDRSIRETPGTTWSSWQSRLTLRSKPDWRLYDRQKAAKRNLQIPDAFLTIQTPKGKTGFFLEMDRGTESATVFARKLVAYEVAHSAGDVRNATGLQACRILTVATSVRRVETLMAVAQERSNRLLFWFIDDSKLQSNLLTDCLWRHAGQPGELSSILR